MTVPTIKLAHTHRNKQISKRAVVAALALGGLALIVTLTLSPDIDDGDAGRVVREGVRSHGSDDQYLDPLNVNYHFHGGSETCVVLLEEASADEGIEDWFSSAATAIKDGAEATARWVVNGTEDAKTFLDKVACAGGEYNVTVLQVKGLSHLNVSTKPTQMQSDSKRKTKSGVLQAYDDQVVVSGNYTVTATAGVALSKSGEFSATGVGVKVFMPVTAELDEDCKVTSLKANSTGATLSLDSLHMELNAGAVGNLISSLIQTKVKHGLTEDVMPKLVQEADARFQEMLQPPAEMTMSPC